MVSVDGAFLFWRRASHFDDMPTHFDLFRSILIYFDLFRSISIYFDLFRSISIYFDLFWSVRSISINRSRLPSVALRAFSDLILVASLYLEWLIGVEVSVANRSRSSQAARRDSSRTNRIPPRGWAGGSEKTRSLSQVSVKDANKKKKLETFAAVPGWSALARRWCSASLARCIYRDEGVETRGMTRHGLL
jgi:hypothetical protein